MVIIKPHLRQVGHGRPQRCSKTQTHPSWAGLVPRPEGQHPRVQN